MKASNNTDSNPVRDGSSLINSEQANMPNDVQANGGVKTGSKEVINGF